MQSRLREPDDGAAERFVDSRGRSKLCLEHTPQNKYQPRVVSDTTIPAQDRLRRIDYHRIGRHEVVQSGSTRYNPELYTTKSRIILDFDYCLRQSRLK